MDVDLEHLQTLIAIAEEGSLSAAARRRHLSQPAVSMQMKALEDALGTRLIHRGTRGISLTAAGEAFLVHARRALQTLDAGRAEVAEVEGLARGSLRLGATDAATEILSSAFLRLHAKHPDIEVSVEIDATAALIRSLRQARLDLVLGTLPVNEPDVVEEELARERLGLVAPRTARVASLGALLAREPFIAYPRGSTTRALIERAMARQGLVPRPVMEIGRPAIMAQLVASGLGVSVLPESVLRPFIKERQIQRVSYERLQVDRSLGLLTLKRQHLDPATRAMREILLASRR
jgi:LysR family transcriptional regulator, cyn operon transcriptional activator